MDLNVMMREQARMGLQAQLDAAVTNGDTEAARKVAADIAKLEVSTAPKSAPYSGEDIKAELNKQEWFGVDPKKSAKAVEFGKTMDLAKFPTAAAFATAIVKAVEEEFKPAVVAGTGKDDDEEDDEDEDDDKDKEKEKPAVRRTDAPGEGDATHRTTRRTSNGPWAKLADAPADVQKEIRRSADKFVPSNAPKERRETFIAKALESHYAVHQQKAGKK